MTSTASLVHAAQPFKRGSPGPPTDASHARKRQRLSPPSDDDNDIHLDSDEFDSDDLAALDEIERAYTQSTAIPATVADNEDHTEDYTAHRILQSASTSQQEPEHRSASPNVPSNVGFVKLSIAALQGASQSRSPSPDGHEEQDYSSWFQGDSSHSGFSSSNGFSTFSGKKWEVSTAALEKSAARFKTWEAEFDKEEDAQDSMSNVLKTIDNVPSHRDFASPSLTSASDTAASDVPTTKVVKAPPVTPARPIFNSPVKPAPRLPTSGVAATASPKLLGMTPRARALQGTRPKFVTPFKQGFGPPSQSSIYKTPQQTRSTFNRSVAYPSTTKPSQPLTPKPGKQQPSPPTSPPTRPILPQVTARPGQLVKDELESLGIPICVIHFDIRTALDFAFTLPSLEPGSSHPEKYTSSAALEDLQKEGCKHATQRWVNNHWSLILWKLAGQIVHSSKPAEYLIEKWNRNEVLRQLHHRYKREYVDGARPPLRRILERDANAGAPMTLCVSSISWNEHKHQDHVALTESRAELILTDGWYFIRACVDAPLSRALKRGLLRVGRKIACQGATLDPSHADGKDIWAAYESTTLMLTGNSTSMAPWHMKLGFHQPFTAGLRSLSSDGGLVSMIDVVVVNAFPAAYIEYHDDGSMGPPRNEVEEREMIEKWHSRRADEQERLWSEFEKQAYVLQGRIEKLKRIAGNRFSPGEDDSMPDYIEDLYDEIVEDLNPEDRFKQINSRDAGWMALFLTEKWTKDRERAASDIEIELATCCPPRNVRNFRVLRVRDAQVIRRPTTRTAQLTVWEARNWGKDAFTEGARFQITNLSPSQPKSWMDHWENDSEIFLITKRSSLFKRVSNV